MRRRIVIAAFGTVPVDSFLLGPWLHRKDPVRRIDDHAAARRSEVAVATFFQAVVCAASVGHVEPVQIRLAVRRAAKVRRRRRHGRWARAVLNAVTGKRRSVPGYQVRCSRVNRPFSSSASAWQTYSKSLSRSGRRIKGSWIVQGFVKTFESSMVASYSMVFGVGHAVSLHHVQRIAVKIAGHVEPCFIVVVGDVHNQRVALPSATRISHPAIHIFGVRRAVCMNQAIIQRPFEGHRNGLGCLKDLKRKIQIHDPGTPGM